jgi:hypothetical protein
MRPHFISLFYMYSHYFYLFYFYFLFFFIYFSATHIHYHICLDQGSICILTISYFIHFSFLRDTIGILGNFFPRVLLPRPKSGDPALCENDKLKMSHNYQKNREYLSLDLTYFHNSLVISAPSLKNSRGQQSIIYIYPFASILWHISQRNVYFFMVYTLI